MSRPSLIWAKRINLYKVYVHERLSYKTVLSDGETGRGGGDEGGEAVPGRGPPQEKGNALRCRDKEFGVDPGGKMSNLHFFGPPGKRPQRQCREIRVA